MERFCPLVFLNHLPCDFALTFYILYFLADALNLMRHCADGAGQRKIKKHNQVKSLCFVLFPFPGTKLFSDFFSESRDAIWPGMWCEKGYSGAEEKYFEPFLPFVWYRAAGRLRGLWFGCDRWPIAVVCSDWSYSGHFQELKKKKSSLEMEVEHAHKQPDAFKKIHFRVCLAV